jgi:hypothetical protein
VRNRIIEKVDAWSQHHREGNYEESRSPKRLMHRNRSAQRIIRKQLHRNRMIRKECGKNQEDQENSQMERGYQ